MFNRDHRDAEYARGALGVASARKQMIVDLSYGRYNRSLRFVYSMTVDLSTQRQRVAWAIGIRSDLAASIQDWVVRQPWNLAAKIADDRLSYSVNLEILEKPPVDRWGFMFADSVHNLRAALDNAVLTIARSVGVTDEKVLRRLKFPIAASEEEWDPRLLRDLPEAWQKMLVGLQPFKAPTTTPAQTLVTLRDLDNQDKHRIQTMANLLPLTLQHGGSVEFETEDGAALSVPPDVTVHVPSLVDGGPLLVQRTRGRIKRVLGGFTIQAQILVDLPNGGREGPVPVLATLCLRAQEVLVTLSAVAP